MAERGERILDAAGELLIAWGYRRVTIEEIARRAKVGKGTVYLHWKTKDSLLLGVALRAKDRSQRRQLARMRADATEILPSRAMRGAFIDYLRDPVLGALHFEDWDILGRLNDIAKKECAELFDQGHRALGRHLEILRGHGLVRQDTDVLRQVYALMATVTGFCMSESLFADRAPEAAEARADVLAQVIRGALETPDAAGPAGTPAHARLTAATPGIIALYEQLNRITAHEMRRRSRT
ncbi:TetR/AcrR family transcriptional regulator [Streptomyces sp. MST-110588]|nr:TetR/AcrR family transcriptional regulator [Streptomyces sp. MST-110588]